MITSSSRRFDLLCEPEKGSFSLHDNQTGLALLQNARLAVNCRQEKKRLQVLPGSWQVSAEASETRLDPRHGLLSSLRLQIKVTEGLEIAVTFALIENHPLFLWRVELINQLDQPIEVEQIELLRVGGSDDQSSFHLGDGQNPAYSFYSNGWQSWSYTGTYLPDMTMRSTRLGLLQEPSIYNPGTPKLRQPGYFTADFFGSLSDLSSRNGLVIGFLSQREHFGTLEALLYDRPSLRMWANGDSALLNPGARMETDWAVISPFSLDDPDPLGEYVRAVAREHELNTLRPIPSGWCSWYHYYAKITPANLRANLQALTTLRETLPLDHFQIDDGFEAQVGDWFDFKPAFVNGVEPLAREIRAVGLTPGLWLAPFILHPKARLIQDHPDWLLRDAKGRPVNCGFGWNALTRGLDLTVPEALEHAAGVMRAAAREWDYPYLKLDFLYAAAVKGRFSDPTRTRAQVLRAGMQALREAAGPETFLVGCGLPLGSGLGLVDSMRIGEDVSGDWHPQHFGVRFLFKNEPCMPSAHNSIRNTLTRSPLHGRWWINDPDCLLVRPETNLTLSEVHSLATAIALTGGALFISDDLTTLPAERRRIIEALLPLIGLRPRVIDLFEQPEPGLMRLDLEGPAGPWRLLARFNWEDRPISWIFDPRDYHLDPGAYLLRSFWDGEIKSVEPGGSSKMPEIPAHGVAVLALRERRPGEALYLGSDLHISQGIEVALWQPSSNGVELELNLPRKASGNIFVALPRKPGKITCNDIEVNWSEVLPGIVQIPVDFDHKTVISIE